MAAYGSRRPVDLGSPTLCGCEPRMIWVVGMSDDVKKSQAFRDAERATADLARAVNLHAPPWLVAELETVKANAEERVETLRHRIKRVEPQKRQPRRPIVRGDVNTRDRTA